MDGDSALSALVGIVVKARRSMVVAGVVDSDALSSVSTDSRGVGCTCASACHADLVLTFRSVSCGHTLHLAGLGRSPFEGRPLPSARALNSANRLGLGVHWWVASRHSFHPLLAVAGTLRLLPIP